jgi:oligoribonuclease NrnB/cAMP/cGMP phosphodiesterase (DHH superfamily)
MKNNFLIFSHEQDVDGLLSAAVLRMAFPYAEVVLTNYGFENMIAIKNKILSFTESNSSGTIIIADLAANQETYKPICEALDISKQRGFSNVWIDHHSWPPGIKEKFSVICELVLHSQIESEGVKRCATELCIERFALTNTYARTLGDIAHRTDFPDSAKFPLPPLTGLISYYLGKKELNHKLYSTILESVIRGILWNVEMQQDMIEASRLLDASISRSIKSMVIREFDYKLLDKSEEPRNVVVAIAKADPFVSRSVLLGKISDDLEIDLAMAYTEEGKLSIRRKRRTLENHLLIDCSKIASRFREGGGHVDAAGGFLKTNVEQSGDAAALVEIESTLESYFDKP